MRAWDYETTAEDVIKEFGANAKGKTYVITGPSEKSIGASVAFALAKAGASRIILIGRSEAKIQPAIEKIKSIDPAVQASWVHADLLDNKTVAEAAKKTQQLTSEVHGLVNCAGIMAPKEFSVSKDGVESQFASNHLGHFLLTNLLLPEIKSVKGTVVNVSSRGFELGGVHLDDVNFNNGKDYNGWLGYSQSKTANVLFSISLAEKLKGSGAAAFAAQPGLVLESGLQSATGITPEFFQEGFDLSVKGNNGKLPRIRPVNLEQGAATLVWALLDPKLNRYSGSFLEECIITTDVKDFASDPEIAEKLWKLSEKLVGQTFLKEYVA